MLRQDLKKIHHKAALRLKTTKDLEKLRHIAANRAEWKDVTRQIYEAAQVEYSDDYSTQGL